MSKKDEKDVMSEIINDISSAAEETSDEPLSETMEEAQEQLEEALDELEEAVEEAEEEAESITPEDAETIIVKFDDDLEAARAVRVLNKAMRKRHETIYQGAIVKREDEDAELQVEDLRDLGLAGLVTGTAAIGIDLGRDGFQLVWNTAAAGFGLIVGGIRLLRRTALLATGLGGSTLTIRQRKHLDAFDPEGEPTTGLEPGETAVVIVADHDTAVDIANDLIKSGGELA